MMKFRPDQLELPPITDSVIKTATIQFVDRDFTDNEVIDFFTETAGKIVVPVSISMARNLSTAYETQLAFSVVYASGNAIAGFIVEPTTGKTLDVKCAEFTSFPNASNHIQITKGSGAETAGVGKIKFTMAYYLIDELNITLA